MHILLIEDDPTTARSVELMLQRASLEVTCADLGEAGLSLALSGWFDLVLLDLGLPDISGIEVLGRLRAAHVHTPILVLTGSDDDEMMLQSFEGGATDYLPKPFHVEALLACIQSIMRRRAGRARAVLGLAGIEMNLKARAVTVEGRPLPLAPREYQMLELMLRRKGTTLTKEMVLDHLYAGAPEPDLKAIDALVCRLRRKLAQASGGECYIYTVWGRGYVLQDPAQLAEQRLAS